MPRGILSVVFIAETKKMLTFAAGKSYTTSSPGTPPGLDRSNGTGL